MKHAVRFPSGSFRLLSIVCASLTAAPAFALAPVDLGSAGNYTALAKTGISTTGTTAITGNIGVSPAAATYITGFGLILDPSTQFATSSLLIGRAYAADYSAPTPTLLTTAISDMETAYADAAGRTLPTATELGAGNIGGMTLVPGLYKWGSGLTIPADVTLAGGANDIWIFQIAQNLDLGNNKKVLLSGGAVARNVFWQVAGQTTLGTGSVMNGAILCQTAIIFNNGASLNGRALAQTAVTLDASTLTAKPAGFIGPNPPTAGATFAYPSPARGGALNVVYFMQEPGRALIRIWNEAGDLASSVEEPRLAGPQKTRFLTADYAAGIYLYKVVLTYDSGKTEETKTRKFVVAK